MNLYLRLFWIIVRTWFKPNVGFTEEVSLSLRVLPNDLDMNFHLNNGRYLTLVDLAIIDLFLRSGVLRQAIKKGWKPTLGGSVITYRKELSLFERYTLSIRLQDWDDRWNYFRFRFTNTRGHICAVGYVKGAMVSKKGLVPNEVADRQFSVKRVKRELPEDVTHWLEAERAISDAFDF